jgi:5'-deoxynucleotidase YfbR-like HD superfamily hydrolase
MTTEQIRELVLNDDDFVLGEIRKLQNIYKLKHEIRYAQDRTKGDLTESVAEHTWGMHIIANYFLALEDDTADWNNEKIFQMITWHDLDEIVIGDIVSYEKLTEHQIDERKIQEEALEQIPEILHPLISVIFDEYEAKLSIESRFVKAVDKIEGYIQMYQSGFKPILHSFGRSANHSHSVIGKHVPEFRYIERFYTVLEERLQSEGYFVKD